MKWFKHHTNAHQGELIAELGHHFGRARGYGLYFLFVELCAAKWDGISEPRFRFHEADIRRFLGINRKFLKTFSDLFQSISENEWIFCGKFEKICEIYFPKLAEIRDNASLSSNHRALAWSPGGPPRTEENRRERERARPHGQLSGASKTEASGPTAPTVVEPDQISGARRQEIRFKCQAEIREVEEMLRHFFKGVVPRQLRYQIPKILDQTSGNVEQVSAILTELWQQPKLRTGEGLNGSATAYAERVILNRFGIE